MTQQDFILRHWRAVYDNFDRLKPMTAKMVRLWEFYFPNLPPPATWTDADLAALRLTLRSRLAQPNPDLPRFIWHDFGDSVVHRILGGLERVGRTNPDGTIQQLFRDPSTGEEVIVR